MDMKKMALEGSLDNEFERSFHGDFYDLVPQISLFLCKI
jgi:hypothetical protein